MRIVLLYLVLFIVEVLRAPWLSVLNIVGHVMLSSRTLTASKLSSESTATVAALLSAELAWRRNCVLVTRNGQYMSLLTELNSPPSRGTDSKPCICGHSRKCNCRIVPTKFVRLHAHRECYRS